MAMQEFAVRPRPPAGVVTRSAPAVQRCGDHPCPPAGCNKEEEQRLARSAVGSAPSVAPPVVHEVIRSPGEPLPPSLNEGMSTLFGHDFARVRVHAGPRAAESAASVAARAYTVGQHVVLGRSAPDLRSPAGQQLLAHELTHVMQQPAGLPGGDLPVSSPGDPGEREAAAVATRAVPSSAPSSARPSVQRDPDPSKRTPYELAMWFYNFYIEQMGYQRKSMGGNRWLLINPIPGHSIDITLDPQSPRMVSLILVGKSYEISEYDFAAQRFQTREQHIEMVE